MVKTTTEDTSLGYGFYAIKEEERLYQAFSPVVNKNSFLFAQKQVAKEK